VAGRNEEGSGLFNEYRVQRAAENHQPKRAADRESGDLPRFRAKMKLRPATLAWTLWRYDAPQLLPDS